MTLKMHEFSGRRIPLSAWFKWNGAFPSPPHIVQSPSDGRWESDLEACGDEWLFWGCPGRPHILDVQKPCDNAFALWYLGQKYGVPDPWFLRDHLLNNYPEAWCLYSHDAGKIKQFPWTRRLSAFTAFCRILDAALPQEKEDEQADQGGAGDAGARVFGTAGRGLGLRDHRGGREDRPDGRWGRGWLFI